MPEDRLFYGALKTSCMKADGTGKKSCPTQTQTLSTPSSFLYRASLWRTEQRPISSNLKFRALVDHYLCLDAFYDRDALKKKTRRNHSAARRNITKQSAGPHAVFPPRAACRMIYTNTIIRGVTPGRIAKRARGVIGRELPRRTGVSATKKRFLSGFTAQGPVCLFETGRSICEKIYEINDNYGLSPFFLTPILTAAQKSGLSIYACYCPLEPESRLEHIFLPELSLGFVRSSTLHPYDAEPYRRIRLDPSCDPALLKKYRQRLRFEKKTAAALIEDACACLARTEESSARLDGLYAPHVDLDGIYASADRLAEKLLTNR